MVALVEHGAILYKTLTKLLLHQGTRSMNCTYVFDNSGLDCTTIITLKVHLSSFLWPQT